MSFETKYLKYKMKYLALKSQVGAADGDKCFAYKENKDARAMCMPKKGMTETVKCLEKMNSDPLECKDGNRDYYKVNSTPEYVPENPYVK